MLSGTKISFSSVDLLSQKTSLRLLNVPEIGTEKEREQLEAKRPDIFWMWVR
jgi:hypothetical protein